jgi:outer membrane protein assembly factor BamB
MTFGADWPQWGGRKEVNFVSGETGLPTEFSRALPVGAGQTNAEPARNVKWSVPLGTQTYSTPAVAGGRIYLGTNDERMKDPRLEKTRGGLILCLDEKTGSLIWELPVPRLKTRNKLFNFDDMGLGICSSPLVAGKRVYLIGSRGDVLCLDTAGQRDGNDGPFTDEGRYIADKAELPDKPGLFAAGAAPPPPEPVKLEATDGDILWRYDFFVEQGVWAQDAVDCSPLLLDDNLYVCTSIGVDKSHQRIPSPGAPDLIVLDAKTGKLLATNDVPIGNAIYHGEWSSPTYAVVKKQRLIIWGGGDGRCYAFDARFERGKGGAPGTLKRRWWFDCNPPHNKFRDGQPLPYNRNHEGPSEIIATPVCVDGRVYVPVGQDSRHGDGPGCLSCFSAGGRGDITETGRLWQCFDVRRSFSSAAVVGGLVFMADYEGHVYCLDAASGQTCWVHKLEGHVFASPFAADGKVYLADDSGKVTVFALAREKKVLAVNRLDAPIYTTPVAANGVLYIATGRTLFALEERK